MLRTDDERIGYCDMVYDGMSSIRSDIVRMTEEIRRTYGSDSGLVDVSERHLHELVDFLDWKLQLLTRSCPFDWRGNSEGVESVVSVQATEESERSELAAGVVSG